ncbi:DUF6928 family protein [Corynebacterium heidelbergense]|uniref:DUF6928 family protein n=1 Tax=Corynebacterium heidelbergense TaxID=2055947 RepID=UPI001EE74D16|nr:hypothetical protein [Corynebacterium heidelbergense]WCZ35997.1 hypothetical protein CHEID_02150 [Corynebacterium heidelbergense]
MHSEQSVASAIADTDQAPRTLVTLWCVRAEATDRKPRAILDAEPQADRGFARKYLAQLNPRWPLTHIGDFDMSRSAPPSESEFYIGAYPGLSVVQVVLPGLLRLTDMPEQLRSVAPAGDIYATCSVPPGYEAPSVGQLDPLADDYTGLAGFAHFRDGEVRRAFSATRERVYEDIGLPEPSESPFWAGNTEASGIQLPFIPAELARAALAAWLGVDPAAGDVPVPVTAFAVDGRPEAKSDTRAPSRPGRRTSSDNPPQPAAVYDDYARTPTRGDASRDSNRDIARDIAVSAGRGLLSGARAGAHGLQNLAHRIGAEVRKQARKSGR